MNFVLGMRTCYPATISRWEEYDGFKFTWGGNGLQPARKKRLVVTKTAEPVNLEILVREIKSANIRQGRPPNVSLRQAEIALKLSGKKMK
jgi:hypothetical protein